MSDEDGRPDPKLPLAAAGRAAPHPVDPATEQVFFSHPEDPLARFQALLELARRNSAEATAMSLATSSEDGRPSVRIVLLKAADQSGFSFFTNLASRKGRELRARKQASLLFHWIPLEVQVRLEGPVTPVGNAEADGYFATRPRGSQLGAWASEQSAPLASRAELEARLAEATTRFEGREVERPPGWGGFKLQPIAIEFWRNRQNRLHDRELYQRESAAAPWRHTLLNP